MAHPPAAVPLPGGPPRGRPEGSTAQIRPEPQEMARPCTSMARGPLITMTFTDSPDASVAPATCDACSTVPRGRSRAANASAGGTKPTWPLRISRSSTASAGCNRSPARTGRVVKAVGAHTSKRTQPQPVQPCPYNFTGRRPDPLTVPSSTAWRRTQPAGSCGAQPSGTMRAPGTASARERTSLTSGGGWRRRSDGTRQPSQGGERGENGGS